MNDGAFLSYSHKDVETVEEIVSLIKDTSGKEVWFDHKLRGGENYFSVIANQIVLNKYFVFVVSENSVKSDWCIRELEFAASENKKIIAIWLEDVEISPRIKLTIQNTHYINWYSAPKKILMETLESAFNESSESVLRKLDKGDNDELIPKNKKYFLTDEDLKRLEKLLKEEEKEKYLTCFIPENANLLGMAYEIGIMVKQDLKKAALYYKSSAYEENPDGKYLYYALKFSMDSSDSDCITKMIEAADQGSPVGMTKVGDNYYYGENGLPVNLEKAYGYFERAAKMNYATAMYYAAYGYRMGEGMKKDDEIALMYALKAKEKGFPRAFRLLGYIYRDGNCVEQSYEKSIEYFDEAIKRGDYLSYCYKGYVYGKLNQLDKKVELYKKAVELAENNEIKSGVPFYRMAVLYDDGEGVEKDYKKATELYLRAAERNHADARKWTVPCILKIDDFKDENEKTELLQKAFDLNCEEAACELGDMEKAKRADPQEKLSKKALDYYEKGAEQGDIKCVLELIFEHSMVVGRGKTDKDREQAVKWFRFLFANADESWIEHWKKVDVLSTYYYAYAIELDFASGANVPDREFVLYNFKKSMEESPRHVGNIIYFAVKGYLFPKESGSGFNIDVPHAEEVLSVVVNYLKSYVEYAKKQLSAEECIEEINKTKSILKAGYAFISKCYKNGDYVKKDKEKAFDYARLEKQADNLF